MYNVYVKYCNQDWLKVASKVDREWSDSLKQELEDDGNSQVLVIPCASFDTTLDFESKAKPTKHKVCQLTGV